MKFRLVLCCAVVLAAACENFLIDPVEQMRDTNKRNIKQLSPGMTRDQAEKLMGDASAGGGRPGDAFFGRLQSSFQVRNPMRAEHLTGPDGTQYEVLFYYTDLRERDDKITDDELTPIVFRDGRIVGIGYSYLGQLAPKYHAYR